MVAGRFMLLAAFFMQAGAGINRRQGRLRFLAVERRSFA
jgi:hypothetical protein